MLACSPSALCNLEAWFSACCRTPLRTFHRSRSPAPTLLKHACRNNPHCSHWPRCLLLLLAPGGPGSCEASSTAGPAGGARRRGRHRQQLQRWRRHRAHTSGHARAGRCRRGSRALRSWYGQCCRSRAGAACGGGGSGRCRGCCGWRDLRERGGGGGSGHVRAQPCAAWVGDLGGVRGRRRALPDCQLRVRQSCGESWGCCCRRLPPAACGAGPLEHAGAGAPCEPTLQTTPRVLSRPQLIQRRCPSCRGSGLVTRGPRLVKCRVSGGWPCRAAHAGSPGRQPRPRSCRCRATK